MNASLGLRNKHSKGDEDDSNYFNIEEIENLLDDGSEEYDILSENISLQNKYTHDNIKSRHNINKDVVENKTNDDIELESIENVINENYSWCNKPAKYEIIAGVIICDDIDDCLEQKFR